MRKSTLTARRVFLLFTTLLMLLLPLSAPADTEVRFHSYNEVMKYIKANHPADLDIGSVRLKPSDLGRIADALAEGGKLSFSSAWCGTVITEKDELIDLNGSTANVSVSDVETLIRLVPGVKKIILSRHRNLSNDQMIPILEKYTEIEFVWLINLGRAYTLSSDATAYSTFKKTSEGKKLKSSDLEVLKYAKDLKALDLGHHEITSLDFLRGLDLEMLILAHNKITDISVLAEMPHLQYAELFMNQITDISPLAACTELLDLNLTRNNVADLTPLDACTHLERLWSSLNKEMTDETKQHFIETHPNCIANFKNAHPTADGWRKHPRYPHYISCLKKHVWIPFSEMNP